MIYKHEENRLPELRFVGGETHRLAYSFQYDDGSMIDLTNVHRAWFSIQRPDSNSRYALRSFTMQKSAAEGMHALVLILDPQDTLDLDGMYDYQITIKQNDEAGTVRIPGHGTLIVLPNLARDLLAD